MKRIFGLLVTMFGMYLLIQVGYRYFSKGYEVKYIVNDHEVYEKYIAHTKGEIDSYYLEIKDGDDLFVYNIYKNFNKRKQIIKKIDIIKGNSYKCMYIQMKNKGYQSNILCVKNGMFNNYQSIIGKDSLLDKQIKELNYKLDVYEDNAEELEKINGAFVMQKNLVKGHYLGLATYRGIFLINSYSDVKFLYEINLFEKGKSNQNVSTFISHYYLVADYEQEEGFDKLYLVDITFGDKSEIKYHSKISFDSYVMGSVGNKVYIFDNSSKKQYEIDIKTKTVIEIGNKTLGIKYYKNGEWETMDVNSVASNKLKFVLNSEKKGSYEKIDSVGGKETGYKYYYKRNGSKYDVYRSTQKSEELTYVFSTDNLNNVVYYKDFVYYEEDNYIKCYQDNIGNKKLFRTVKGVYSEGYNFSVTK